MKKQKPAPKAPEKKPAGNKKKQPELSVSADNIPLVKNMKR